MTPAKSFTTSMISEAKSLLHECLLDQLEKLIIDAMNSDEAPISSLIDINITLGISAEQISSLANQVPDPMDEYI